MADPVSDRLYLGRIVPGMDVCDVSGEKVGSISHIHRVDENTMVDPSSRDFEEIIEVSSGFLGLGKRFYIPMSAVQEVLTDSVYVNKSREAFGELGYERKPEHLSSLT